MALPRVPTFSGTVASARALRGRRGKDAADVLARRTLKLDGSRLALSRSGAPLDAFLLTHGRADGHEREELAALFLRMLGEGKA